VLEKTAGIGWIPKQSLAAVEKFLLQERHRWLGKKFDCDDDPS
jgi:hypothetical protein